MLRSSRVTLLAALESTNGKKWVALYRDDAFSRPLYYCTHSDGGENLGLELKEAAARVVAIAQDIKPKVYKLELTEETRNKFA